MHSDSDGMESCIILWSKFTMTLKCTQVVVMLAVGFEVLHWVGIFIQGGDSNSSRVYYSKAFESFCRSKWKNSVGMYTVYPSGSIVLHHTYAIGLSSHHGCNQRFVQNWILKIIRKDKSLVNSSDQL